MPQHNSRDDELDFTLLKDPRFHRFLQLAELIKISHPSIHKSIIKEFGDNPQFEHFFRVLMTEVRNKSIKKQLAATKLLAEFASLLSSFSASVSDTEQREAITYFGDLLAGGSTQLSTIAAGALGSFARTHARLVVPLLAHSGISNEDGETACAALLSLSMAGSHAASTAIPAICNAAKQHKDPLVRATACDTLENLGEDGREAVPVLAQLVVSNDTHVVRLAALRALLIRAVGYRF